VNIGELRLILDRLRELYIAAGAKGPATDLKAFSDALEPHAERSVDEFCTNVREKLHQAGQKPKVRKKTPLNEEGIGHHVTQLRGAGTDRQAFDAAFDRLKADQIVKASDVAEIARRYADSVTKYKSTDAALSAISKAFVRQARFENKLR
jgi:hypothetical protein